jgi:predicted AAA+ superfamily ATPase
MISLVQLLKEVQSSPKAILMAGPAGAGKSYILNQLGLQNFTTINVDDDFEELYKKN